MPSKKIRRSFTGAISLKKGKFEVAICGRHGTRQAQSLLHGQAAADDQAVAVLHDLLQRRAGGAGAAEELRAHDCGAGEAAKGGEQLQILIGEPFHAEFSEQYARARDLQADKLFDEALEIADATSGDWIRTEDGKKILDHEHVQRSRLP